MRVVSLEYAVDVPGQEDLQRKPILESGLN